MGCEFGVDLCKHVSTIHSFFGIVDTEIRSIEFLLVCYGELHHGSTSGCV